MKSRSEQDGLDTLSPTDLNILSVGISTGGKAEIKMLNMEPKRQVTATTLDENGLEMLRKQVEGTAITGRLDLRIEDISSDSLPYADTEFDFVYARLVLHYLSAQDLQIALRNIHRILKEGGRVFIVVRSKDTQELTKSNIIRYDKQTCLTTYRAPSGRSAVRYFHTIESISAAVKKAGFTPQSVGQFDEDLSPGFNRDTGQWIPNNVIELVATKG